MINILDIIDKYPNFRGIKEKIHYKQPIEYSYIENLSYSDNFENIIYTSNDLNIPFKKNRRELINVTDLFVDFTKPLEKRNIPNSVIKLTIGGLFNQSLKELHIPNSVTHLILSGEFNQPLEKGDIPFSVTYLAFIGKFNQPLEKEDIPFSVTHLILWVILINL